MQNSTPCPVNYFEIGCTNIKETAGFYTEIFGWTGTDAGIATYINTNTTEGIQGHITALGHEPHNYVTVYITVPDINVYLLKIEERNGKKIVGPVMLPDGSRFAWFKDPNGNIMGLFDKPKQ